MRHVFAKKPSRHFHVAKTFEIISTLNLRKWKFHENFRETWQHIFGFAVIFRKNPVWFIYGDNIFWLLKPFKKVQHNRIFPQTFSRQCENENFQPWSGSMSCNHCVLAPVVHSDKLNVFFFLFNFFSFICAVDEPVVLTLTPSSLLRTRTEAEARRTSRTTTPSSSTTCCRPWTAYILDCCLAEHSLYPGLSPIRQFLHYRYDWENKIRGPGSQGGGTTGGIGEGWQALYQSCLDPASWLPEVHNIQHN